ncbi:hypothetical protein SeW_A2295 [Salmonella enterica subsp. enterica serovar Weltevreden str. HI_N05-537]|nr:hypothetical protein SeW_A2295 [Salmonella enterica subsp. enterica serovar Weltevreden str. HI_N05-537]
MTQNSERSRPCPGIVLLIILPQPLRVITIMLTANIRT